MTQQHAFSPTDRLIAITLLILLVGCVPHRPADIRAGSLEGNGLLMSQPTPSDWQSGSLWRFVKLGQDGTVLLDATFRITDSPAQTCSSGDWHVLELVEGRIGGGGAEFTQAYSVSGRLLTLDLTGWCDLGGIQGELTEGTFMGQTTGGPFTRGKFAPQRVEGRRIH